MKSVFEKLITLCIFIICLIASGCSHTSSSPEGQSLLSGTRQTEVVLDSPAFTSQRLSSAEIVSEADCSIEFITEVNQFGNLTYTLTSHSDKQYSCGDSFELDYQRDNEWYIIPQKDGYGFNMIAYELSKDAPLTFGELLQWSFSNLPEGHYRLVKEIMPPSYERNKGFYIASEFDFKKPSPLEVGNPEGESTATPDSPENPFHEMSSVSLENAIDKNLASEADVLSDGTVNLIVTQLEKGKLGLGTYYYRMNLNFLLEYQFNNEWFAVPANQPEEFQKGTIQVTPLSQEYRIMLPWLYKTLPAGHYRLIEQIEEFNPYLENLTVDTFYIATEFDYPYQF